MGFLESFKHLDKLCGEIMGTNKGITAYIDEMLNTTMGHLYVSNWEDDLDKLRYCRRIRNKISHDLGCTEQNTCKPEDALWLDGFYSRIMNQTDPLSLYRQYTKPRTAKKPSPTPSQNTPSFTPIYTNSYNQTNKNTSSEGKHISLAAKIAISLLVIAGLILLFKIVLP